MLHSCKIKGIYPFCPLFMGHNPLNLLLKINNNNKGERERERERERRKRKKVHLNFVP